MAETFDLWQCLNNNEKIRKHLDKLKDRKEEVERVVKAFTAPRLELRATIEIAREKGKITGLEYRKLYEENIGIGQFIELSAALNAVLPLIKNLGSLAKGKPLDPSQTTLFSFMDRSSASRIEERAGLIELPKKRAHNVVVLDAFMVGSTSVNGFPKSINANKGSKTDERR